MNPLTEDIRQHDTHGALAGYAGLRQDPVARLELDAIIVPATRPAAHLDHAVMLARAADCWLLILCSQQLHSAEARKFLAARSHHKAIVIDLPPGYKHELLYFPGALSLKNELPLACHHYATDLSMKRNIGLALARMLRWHRIFFLDDDIRDITYPDLQSTVNMLGSFSAAGLWVTDFPDNSIACHANRVTEGAQDVFVSGAALAVNCDADIGFFPDIYNEDWLFFFDNVSQGLLANSCLKATQLCYYPFANARRAAWQEFGDVLAEGLYALLHRGMGVQHATREYWVYFLKARRNFLKAIITRSDNSHPDIRDEMLRSVQSALECSLMIKPDLCERYVQLWRQDLTDWKRRAARIPAVSSVEEALQKMRLTPSVPVSGAERLLPRRSESAPNVQPGRAVIPQFDTLKDLSEQASSLQLSPIVPAQEQGDTKPLPKLTEYSEMMLAAKSYGGYSPWATAAEADGQPGRSRRYTVVSRLTNARSRRRGSAQPIEQDQETAAEPALS